MKTGDVTDRTSAPRGRKADTDESTAEDWGLSGSRPGMSLAKKLALALGLAAVAGGGAYGYMYYFPKTGETAGAESNVVDENSAGEGEKQGTGLASGSGTTESDDPFADPPTKRTGLAGRTGAAPELMPVPGDDDLDGTLPDRKFQPRTVSRGRLSDPELELDQDVDDSKGRGNVPPALVQSEPGEESPELLNVDVTPQLRSSGVNARSTGTERNGIALRTESARSTQRPSANKPVVSSDDPFADKLDGYTVVEEKNSLANARLAPSGPDISGLNISGQGIEIPDADEARDERLQGFQVQDDLSARRAISRTVVTRSPAGIPGRNSGARLTAGFEGTTVEGLEGAPPVPSAARGGASMIVPKRASPPAGTAFDAARGVELRSAGPAAGEIYTVAPNDNYWTISRKQYGTSKYFMALSRHNETRIPDPQRMRPGMKVETPPAEVLEQRYPDLIEKSPRVARKPAIDDGVPHFGGSREGDYLKEAPLAPGSVPGTATDDGPAGYFVDAGGAQYYRVGSDDTLTGIAQRHLGRASRWMEVYELNRKAVKNPDALTIGTVIRLPADASRLSLVPDTERRR